MLSRIQVADMEFEVEVRGQGEPLLLVHGFPLDHSMWQYQLDGCAGFCRAIAPDLRGFGGTSERGEIVTMEQFADDLALLLDALQIQEPVNYCGLSMGGYIGWQFFQRHRRRVKRLIQCDTRAAADSPEAAGNRRKTAAEVLEKGAAQLATDMTAKLFSRETIQSQSVVVPATQQVIRSTKPVAIAAALRGMAQRPDVTSDLKNIDVPTLLICGTDDAITPCDEMRQVAEAIPGAKFVEIPLAGHMSPLENPVPFNEALREFLQST